MNLHNRNRVTTNLALKKNITNQKLRSKIVNEDGQLTKLSISRKSIPTSIISHLLHQ